MTGQRRIARASVPLRKTWDEWAKKTPETAAFVESHKTFIDRIGLGQ